MVLEKTKTNVFVYFSVSPFKIQITKAFCYSC